MAEHIVSKRHYIGIWVVLMCLTALTAGLSLINLSEWSTVVALLIAAAKALLVALFFMHLFYEREKMVWVWATVAIFWLGILMIMTAADYITRGFLRVPGK